MGAKGHHTCRHCDKPVYRRTPATGSRFDRPWWSHAEVSEAETEYSDPDKICRNAGAGSATPKEVCCAYKNDGTVCETKVKLENVESGDYSCGVHMKQWLDAKEYAERTRKWQEERAEQEEMAKWELSHYAESYERLRRLNPEMFPDDERIAPRLYFGRLDNTVVELDIVELERWFRELGLIAG